ncbi:MAG: transcription termination/antitermination factor NusG [Clostridia bacterium]|nr:transcription termination/antitermination factor NusG [Clostridia bacterium]
MALKIEEAKKDAKWYVLHTFSGYENVAKENLEIVIDKYNLQLRIFDIVIPMEDVVEEKDGKRKVVTRKLMPGYILVKMNYGDDIWHAVTRTRGITGFVGPKGRPLHLGEEEIRKMHLEKVSVVNIDLQLGAKVEILDGALSGFVGTVNAIDESNNKVRVVVEMFGRETPVDVSLDQVKEVK